MSTSPEKVAKILSLLDNLKNDNNKIISIGTSPSFLTEALSTQGADVIFLPISNANLCTSHNHLNDYFDYYPNFKLVGDYLKYKGLTPANLRNKNVILLDYSSSGRTLHLVKRLINEYCKIPEDKIITQDLIELINNACDNYKSTNQNGILPFDIDEIKNDIINQKVENASNVPHFSIFSDMYNKKAGESVSATFKPKKVLFKEFDELSRPQARAYQLCVLHELDKLNNKKEQL